MGTTVQIPKSPTFSVRPKAARETGTPPSSALAVASGRQATMENAVYETEDPEAIVAEIDKLWGEAQDKFLAIGRWLNHAFKIHHRTFEETIVRRLPFGRIVAYQLRVVAEAVDSNRLPEPLMPRSYSTAYKLVSLPAVDFEEARNRNLLRPDVSRPEVERFKRDLIREREPRLSRTQALRHERGKLEAEAAELEKRFREVRERLAAIAEEIGPDGPGTMLEGVAEEV